MRTITITRKKSILGVVIKYYCIHNMSMEEVLLNLETPDGVDHFTSGGDVSLAVVGHMVAGAWTFKSNFLDESDQVFPLSNGDSVTINLNDTCENSIVVIAMTSTGLIFSNQAVVRANGSYVINTKFGIKATKLIIEEI